MSESRHNKNLRELFSLYPLGCESFGAQWLRRWEAIGKLLDSRCIIQSRHGREKWHDKETWSNVGRAIVAVSEWSMWPCAERYRISYRIVLRDHGRKIVREWLYTAQ